VEALVEDAVRWVSGQISSPRPVLRETAQGHDRIIVGGYGERPQPPNDGVKLIAAVLSFDKAVMDRFPLMFALEKVQNDGGDIEVARRMLDRHDEHLEALQQEISDARDALWALSSDSGEAEESASNG
jgi:hypothetical protein